MVGRVLIDDNEELVEITRKFVCLKFNESDDDDEYYTAARYFLPQWYWQPILAICWPDGTEVNVHWRHTHQAPPVKVIIEHLRDALKVTGEGLDAAVARKNRRLCDRAQAALEEGRLDEAQGLAREASTAVDVGWTLTDARRIGEEVSLRKKIDDWRSRMPEGEWTILQNALHKAVVLCGERKYDEALPRLVRLAAGSSEIAAMARDFEERTRSILLKAVELGPISLDRFRVGAEIYHEGRGEFRSSIPIDNLWIQYYLLSGDGKTWSGCEGYSQLAPGNHLRAAAYLPYRLIGGPEEVLDLRVELWLGGEMLTWKNLDDDSIDLGWWRTREVYALTHEDVDWGSWYRSLPFPGEGGEEASVPGDRVVFTPALPVDLVFEEVRTLFEEMESGGRRGTGTAVYRMIHLGREALPFLVPLAHPHGAITTIRLISVVNRIRHEDAARAFLEILFADDVTLSRPAERLTAWLEGVIDVPLPQLADHLKSTDERIRLRAIKALGDIGNPLVAPALLAHIDAWPADSTDGKAVGAALERLACTKSGKDPNWWKGSGEETRAILMARALESEGIAEAGVVRKLVEAKNGKSLLAILTRSLNSESDLAQRAAVFIIKDLAIRELLPQLMERLEKRGMQDPSFGLVRNTIREMADKDVIADLIPLMVVPGRGPAVCDLIMTLTGESELYPEGGTRLDPDGWKEHQEHCESWWEVNRQHFHWNDEEKFFQRGG